VALEGKEHLFFLLFFLGGFSQGQLFGEEELLTDRDRMGKMLRRAGSTATLLWIVLAVSTPRGINADAAEDCPEFASSVTVVQTAPDCAAEVDIPYKLQSTSWKSVEVTILDENAAEKNVRFHLFARLQFLWLHV
jgi:hypothetical protein